MKSKAQIVARFGLLAALSLVLGYFDRAIPITWLLGGAVPGIKLGLANTVLLYAVYLMDWRSCVALMLTKVFLSGFLFGSMSAILYSLSGGVLSLLVMLLTRKNARAGALTIAALTALSDIWLLYRNPRPGGQMLICVILIALACVASVAAFVVIRIHPEWGVLGVSLAGAVAHNVGQILMASRVLRTPQLLYTYLPVLVGVGAVVGTLTGLVAQRVFRALRIGEIN
ncbi:MAG: Gx transporter family protein [Clostridia bacterium]|nr:Gx transporter family protein [Clostridia bacterium]